MGISFVGLERGMSMAEKKIEDFGEKIGGARKDLYALNRELRYGDILDGKRTWAKELAQSNVRPTLKDAVAGDITAAMPYRAMTNIIEFIRMLDQVVPGFASAETLLYSPELKFYSNKVKMDTNLNTNIGGLHCLGDSSGWTRGLMMASAMGVLMGRKLLEKEN